MKFALLVSSSALAIAIASCTPQDTAPGTAGTGGKPGTGGGATSSGGATGSGGASGGSSASGGSTGTGGDVNGTGGANSGGSTGSGGGSASGGSTGSGGGSASGGSTGSGGGSATGGRGTGGGTPGTGGAGGGNAGGTAIVGELDGFLYTAPCGDAGTGFDCINTMCVIPPAGGNAQRDFSKVFTIGGTAGQIYSVTFNVRGITETKNYSGGTRRAGTTLTYAANGADFWHEGGTIPFSTYNTYELHVDPPVAGAANVYYMNSRGGTGENHESYVLGYSATIKVPGGGKVTFRSFDSNCRQIMNCGPGTGSSATGCRAPTTLPLTGALPQPANFVQPYVGTAPGGKATGQWIFIDVTSVQ